MVKNPPANAGDLREAGSILGREDPWRRAWPPMPVFLGNPLDRGVWWATVHGVAESDRTEVM